jgi:hypothetical protein
MTRRVDRRKERKLLRDLYDRVEYLWYVLGNGGDGTAMEKDADQALGDAMAAIREFDASLPSGLQPVEPKPWHIVNRVQH